MGYAENANREITHCLIQARIAYDNSRFSEAMEWWNKALILDPNDKEALKYINKMKDKVKYPVFKSEVPQPNENNLNRCLIQARIAYDNSRFSEAMEWWNRALILDPNNKEALKYITNIQDKVERPIFKIKAPQPKPQIKAAAEKLLESEEISSKTSKMKKRASSYILEGKKYYQQHMYKWAISEWKNALTIDPTNSAVAEYIERAEARLKQKPEERKPVEADMLPKEIFVPSTPQPVFQKPTKETLNLEDSIELGFKNHLPVQIAKEQVKLARFKERESFRELFPAATIRWDESSGVVSERDFKGRKYNIKVQHPLYNGGELKYTWEQAKVNLKIANENYNKSKDDYSIELTKAYYDLVKAMKNFEVQDRLLKDLDEDLSMSKKEFDAALTTLVEFLNIQSQYNQVYYACLSAENSLLLAKSNFLQLLNLDRDPTVNIKVDTNVVFKEQTIDLEKCINLAYENRADLKINDLGLKSAEYGEKVAKSQQLPKIDLTGNVGRSGEAFTPSKVQLSDEWFVGAKVNVPWGPNTLNYSHTKENIAPSLTVYSPTSNTVNSLKFNILDNLASYTEGQRAEVTYEQAYSDLLKGKQTAATEVREAYFNYQESTLKVKNSIANKELYQKELAIVKEKRSIAEAQSLDIVQTKVKLAAEETNYNSAVSENLLAVAKLNKAIGIKNYFK